MPDRIGTPTRPVRLPVLMIGAVLLASGWFVVGAVFDLVGATALGYTTSAVGGLLLLAGSWRRQRSPRHACVPTRSENWSPGEDDADGRRRCARSEPPTPTSRPTPTGS
jgi:hypothetical protein